MRMEYLIVSIIIVVVVLFALIAFGEKIFPSFGKSISDLISGIGK